MGSPQRLRKTGGVWAFEPEERAARNEALRDESSRLSGMTKDAQRGHEKVALSSKAKFSGAVVSTRAVSTFRIDAATSLVCALYVFDILHLA